MERKIFVFEQALCRMKLYMRSVKKYGEYVKRESSIFCKLELKNVLDIDVHFLTVCHDVEKKNVDIYEAS